MKKIAILGFARDGQAAYDYWLKPGNELTICDQNTSIKLPAGAKSQLGDGWLNNLDEFDLLVRTAGLPPSLITAANPNEPGILGKVTGNISEFLRVCPSKNVIGVTGTKGKGTTSTLIAKMLGVAGQRVHLGGNIGIPALELLKEDIQPDDWVVLEQSSFQLIDQQYSPHISVCLMVVPEHLNWHKDMDEYVRAKKQLFAHQKSDDVAIYYAANLLSEQIANASSGTKIPFMKAPGAYVEDGSVVMEGNKICKTSEIKLLGEHNWQNICAAVTAVWQVTQDIDAVRSVVTTFTGLEHRLELVREVDGVKYFNDSFSTTPDAAIAALKAISGLKIVIVGGFDRQLPLEHLAEAIKENKESIHKLLLIGASKERLKDLLDKTGFNNYELLSQQNLSEIILYAKSLAGQNESIVFSPGFPSFDMFKDFEDRGQQFKKNVAEL